MSEKLLFIISFVLVLSLASVCFGEPNEIKLDIDAVEDVNTEPNFTSFTLADSGSDVCDITIDFGGLVSDARRDYPVGVEVSGVYYRRAGEEMYRDFVSGVYPGSVEITLWGLGANQDCNITIWAFDNESTPNRVANWYGNGSYLFTTDFNGGAENWPDYEYLHPEDINKYAFGPSTAQADQYGRIVLTSTIDPCSVENVFSFVNALMVTPKPPYVASVYAQRPVPFNGTEDVPVDTFLNWRKGAYAEKHDVYLGTDFNDVNDANRTIPLGVLVSQNQSDTNYTPPGILGTGRTYYWRIDEVNSAPDYTIFKGQLWCFTTHVPVLIASNPVPLDGAQRMLRDVILSWEKGEYAEKHDVYFGTNLAKVTDANRNNPMGVLVSQNHLTTNYDPPELLDFNTTYYWRIDEVNSAPDYAIFKGNVWSFTIYEPTRTWRVDARCFLSGPPGSFDDIAVKDPSIVYAGGKWHLFYTYVGHGCTYCMGYANATSIAGLQTATRISIQSSVHGCAPHVFWFEPQQKWYLIHYSDFSTNTDINNVNGWTAGQSMGFSDGLDHVCISDGDYMYCFYSRDNGNIYRRSTTIADFPFNWSSPTTVATETFEGVQVYKNIADGKFYMIIESLGGGISRYYELWTADNPGGTWTKLQEQWAHKDQLVDFADHWTDQVSHGEIIRTGKNERMEIYDIDRCKFLIQGVVDGNYGDYGSIPYDLGIIRQCLGSISDIDYDYDVDSVDYAILASQWLEPPDIPSADIAPLGGDGIVDMKDLSLLVDSWLWGK